MIYYVAININRKSDTTTTDLKIKTFASAGDLLEWGQRTNEIVHANTPSAHQVIYKELPLATWLYAEGLNEYLTPDLMNWEFHEDQDTKRPADEVPYWFRDLYIDEYPPESIAWRSDVLADARVLHAYPAAFAFCAPDQNPIFAAMFEWTLQSYAESCFIFSSAAEASAALRDDNYWFRPGGNYARIKLGLKLSTMHVNTNPMVVA